MILLTSEQQRVVEHAAGKLLVRAPAGSGKTTTICAHVKRLVEVEGVSPRDVLVTTFSKRGAKDMARKGRALAVPFGVRYQTLHAVAYGILREARKAAVAARPDNPPPEYLVIDGGKQFKLRYIVKTELDRLGRSLGLAKDRDGHPAGVRPLDVEAEIGRAKAALVAPDAWTTADGETQPAYFDWATTREREPLSTGPARLIGAVYAVFERAKRDPFAYDAKKFAKHQGEVFLTFDDMLFVVAQAILKGSRWVQDWLGSYSWVFVDEVQDNSWPQWVLCLHLSAGTGNLVAIGDDQQSIYAFRGAAPALMRAFLTKHAARCEELTLNFRSRPAILDAANGLLAHAEDRITDGMMIPGRSFNGGGNGSVTLRHYHDPKDEALHVAEQIHMDLEDGRDANEMVVLYRTNAQSAPVEVELMKRGIRYRVAGHSFFERAAVKTAMGYLRLALDRGDVDAWQRVYCLPLRGLGRTYLDAYPTADDAFNAINAGSMVRSGWIMGTRDIERHVEAVRLALEGDGLGAALTYISEDIGVRKHYRDEDADDADVTETDEMMRALIECGQAVEDAGVLVAYADDMTGNRKSDHAGETTEAPLVTLSTAHAAKGLEWGTVYLVGFNADVFPHKMALYSEERRLAYVAITRAKDAAHVSWTDITLSGAAGRPSPLVSEIPALAGASYMQEGGFVE